MVKLRYCWLLLIIALLFPFNLWGSEIARLCEKYQKLGDQIKLEDIPQEDIKTVLRESNLDPNTPRDQVDWIKVCSTGQDPIIAENRLALEVEYLTTDAGGTFRTILGLGFGFAKNQTFTIRPTVIGTNLSGQSEWGFGDLVLRYLIVPYINKKAKWWPMGMGFRFDLTLPTGDFSRGTGGGSFVLNPRIILGWRPFKNFRIYPTFKYFHSIGVNSGAGEFRTLSIEADMTYDLPLRFWISVSPEIFFRFASDEITISTTFKFGKMIFKRYGMWIEYELIGLDAINIDGLLPTKGFNHKFLLGNQFLF